MIFGTRLPKATGHQMAIQFPTSPNTCSYTTWGKQNIRNMHWNEQQTSTNWRLHLIKIWSRWSELMKYIIYLLTIVLPAIKCVASDTFVFQQDSAPAHWCAKRSNCCSAKPQILSVRICGPPTALTSIWSITSSVGSCNSRSIRRRSRMWIVDELKKRLVEIWIGLEQNIIDTAINAWRNRLRACVRTKGRHFKHLL